ncbi:carnitine O-palmitoyltransferase 1, liver isoform-like [Montipora capricornis]|uniref:carnitine O-palmitoyltransferase 1, liver isoform-like n=1 Tax=Montipora foliosa TaxID=591990 RepID=UPI0035F1F8E4
MAEARAAVTRPDVRLHAEGTSTTEAEVELLKSTFTTLKKCAFRTRRQIANGLWPTTWSNLSAAVVAIGAMLYATDFYKLSFLQPFAGVLWKVTHLLHLDEAYPYHIRLVFISTLAGVVFFALLLYLRQYTLRMLLAYRGWMYEPPRSQSILTLLWGLMVKLCSGQHPTLFSYQNSLPRMSVPNLSDTCKELLNSVKPILDDKEFKRMEVLAKDFEKNLGPKLQFILKLKSWWAPNYHTDWWEKYVYLMGRSPLPINSNYYCLDQNWHPTLNQASRAATISYFFLKYYQELQTESLEPLLIRKTIPICMWQYERNFRTTRIPKEDVDEIVHFEHTENEHIVVFCGGNIYMLPVTNSKGKYISVLDLESQFEWIQADAKHSDVTKDQAEGSVPALTALPRKEWAGIRKEYFSEGVNRQTLEAIEESLFVVILEEKSFPGLSDRAKYLFHGDGRSFWFDKSFCFIVFSDGKCGINAEHSWADAPVVGHMFEYAVSYEFIYRTYDEKGKCTPIGGAHRSASLRTHNLQKPTRLYWDMTPKLTETVENAVKFAQKNNDDAQQYVLVHDAFGKGLIKKMKISPDAFIQLSLQLAYYKDSGGRHPMTYESSMTRMYLQGRTETVRSFTMEAKEFVLAFLNKAVPPETKYELLLKAADLHAKRYKDCMNGMGIDRHLFALYVVCKGQGYESEFLKSSLSIPWTLSTSQSPQQQMASQHFSITEPELAHLISPGGGFGPVADDGYGISYMVPDDHKIFFHISSKISSKQTDSDRFVKYLFESMSEIKDLYEVVKEKKAQEPNGAIS